MQPGSGFMACYNVTRLGRAIWPAWPILLAYGRHVTSGTSIQLQLQLAVGHKLHHLLRCICMAHACPCIQACKLAGQHGVMSYIYMLYLGDSPSRFSGLGFARYMYSLH